MALRSVSFEQLLLELFRAVEAGGSWTPFFASLTRAMNLEACTLILRMPSTGDLGELHSYQADIAFEDIYRSIEYRDDPFRAIAAGVACSLDDVISPEALKASSFYKRLLEPDGTTDILALNVVANDGQTTYIRLSRRQPENPFGVLEKSLLTRLLPYLESAFRLHEQRRRLLLERSAHIGALDQLAFGLVIIDEAGRIVRVNETAQRLLSSSSLLRVDHGRLCGGGGSTRVENAVAAMHHAGEGERQFLRLTSPQAGEYIQMLLRPISPAGKPEAREPCGVAVFLNDEVRNRDIYLGRFGQLYGLSPAEIALIDELLQGSSIAIAADKLGISENTARTQLRSVFSKTNVHRQAELIRLVLTSLAIIA
jgi:DNA-binding CsgD family transcriptional regulator/PAS domain-containing protein